MLTSLKVYSPGYQAVEWGFAHQQCADFDTVMQQPHKIAVLPVFYNNPTGFAWNPAFENLTLEKFDLVLFTDIEFRTQKQICEWINTINCPPYLLCIGGLHKGESKSDRVVYRPYWSFNFLQWAKYKEVWTDQRPFLFDCLFGARREHRDYVMLALQNSNLLDQSIVNYRDVFLGNTLDCVTDRVQAEFPTVEMHYPYVSPNLDPAWEVSSKIDNTISHHVPWEIWQRCYYHILVETLGTGADTFFMSEKAGRAFYAKRMFVHFGTVGYLAGLKHLGFETFGSVLDESYDVIQDDIKRWHCAFEQVKFLSQQNHPVIMHQVRPIVDHNHNRLLELKQELLKRMQSMIYANLK